MLLANGGDITDDDHNGMVNSAHSFIKKLTVRMNGNDVYTCSEANHVTNIKNLLKYSQGYVKSQGTNEFFYIDTNRHAQELYDGYYAADYVRVALRGHYRLEANYNKGFAARKALLGTSSTVKYHSIGMAFFRAFILNFFRLLKLSCK